MTAPELNPAEKATVARFGIHDGRSPVRDAAHHPQGGPA